MPPLSEFSACQIGIIIFSLITIVANCYSMYYVISRENSYK